MKVSSVVFYTHDLKKVKAFYIDILGLSLDYETETFISFNFPDGIKLGIKVKKEVREIPGSQTVFLTVSNLENEYHKYLDKECTFSKHLTHEAWGSEFAILDPDGNKLTFIEKKE